MIGSKRTAIFPLGITGPISFADCDPTMPADGLSLAHVSLLEPRDHQRPFGFELAMSHVVVRQRAIERILPRNECHWDVATPRRALRVIEPTVIRLPIQIPRAPEIGHRIVSARLFTNPEHRRYDVGFPWITLDRRARTGRDKHLRLDF